MVWGKQGDFLSPPGVLVLTQIINPFRTIPFNMKDQFGLAYGGLRGAISFALAFTLPDNIGRRQLFITATIAIILFTVFLQVRRPSLPLAFPPHASPWRLMSQRTSLRCHVFSPLQGISIRPLIEFINVRRTNRNVGTINVEVHCRVSPRRPRLSGAPNTACCMYVRM